MLNLTLKFLPCYPTVMIVFFVSFLLLVCLPATTNKHILQRLKVFPVVSYFLFVLYLQTSLPKVIQKIYILLQYHCITKYYYESAACSQIPTAENFGLKK